MLGRKVGRRCTIDGVVSNKLGKRLEKLGVVGSIYEQAISAVGGFLSNAEGRHSAEYLAIIGPSARQVGTEHIVVDAAMPTVPLLDNGQR